MNNTTKTEIFVSGHCVGKVVNGAFVKNITGSKHLLRSPRAIALAVTALDDAERAGANTIGITDIETGLIYTSTFAHFRKHCFAVNRGYEPQLAMRLDQWDVTGGKISNQVEKNKRGKRTPAPGEDPAYTAALELPPMQLFFDIFRNYRHD